MKIITYISAGAFIVLSACIMNKEAANQQAQLYDTKWMLKKIETPAGIKEVSTKAFIRFNKEKKSAGGNGSCNSFGSTIIVQSNEISFSDIFSTKMYCEDVQETENMFLKNLRDVKTYQVKDRVLKLFGTDNNLLLEFTTE